MRMENAPENRRDTLFLPENPSPGRFPRRHLTRGDGNEFVRGIRDAPAAVFSVAFVISSQVFLLFSGTKSRKHPEKGNASYLSEKFFLFFFFGSGETIAKLLGNFCSFLFFCAPQKKFFSPLPISTVPLAFNPRNNYTFSPNFAGGRGGLIIFQL